MKRKEVCEHGNAEAKNCYNLADEVMDCNPLNEAARFPGEIQSYIAKNQITPRGQKLRESGGTVKPEFTVWEDGRVSDIYISKGLHRSCDEEAVRLLQEMPAWIPEYLDGEPVPVTKQLSIGFWAEDGEMRDAGEAEKVF